jgi:hypothetical protein
MKKRISKILVLKLHRFALICSGFWTKIGKLWQKLWQAFGPVGRVTSAQMCATNALNLVN